MNFKKLAASVVVPVAVMATVTACGTSTQNTTDQSSTKATNDYQKIKQQGVIYIGTEGTYSPFTYHDASGKLTGFDVEIAEQVAQRIGVKADFVETPWDGMFAGLNDKRFDMVANEVGIEPDREAKYDFSTPYIVSEGALITSTSNNSIHGFQDLKGKKAAQSLTSNYAAMAKQYGAQVVAVNGFNDAISMLASNRVDATINDKLSYLDLKKHQPNAPVKMVAQSSDAAKSAFLFRKGDTQLEQAVDKALASMMKDGTYKKISEKYFGEDVSK